MKQTERKNQEQLFCVFMARGFSPEEAARRAGFNTALCPAQGSLLLASGRIRTTIRRLSRELDFCSPSALAKAGLTRIALGDLSGALALLDEDAPIPATAELLGISEIKRPKGGGVELKLFDRIRALSAIAELDGGRSEASGTLLAALARSAQGLDEMFPEAGGEEIGDGGGRGCGSECVGGGEEIGDGGGRGCGSECVGGGEEIGDGGGRGGGSECVGGEREGKNPRDRESGSGEVDDFGGD